eukprot:2724590-Rhodomonas_salina.2
MGTPATALASVIHTVVIWFGVLWISALVISRVYMFHDAYQRIQQRLETDAPLRESCYDQRFVQMMQQHPEVCARALHEAEMNPWLTALNEAASTPTLCGEEECSTIIARLFARGGWTALGCAIIVVIFSPQMLMPLVNRSKSWQKHNEVAQNCWPGYAPAMYPQYPTWCHDQHKY